MSNQNYITEMLELKDNNVKFKEKFYFCKINLKVHNCCAVSFVISYNILHAIYLSFKGGILLCQIIVTYLMKIEKL